MCVIEVEEIVVWKILSSEWMDRDNRLTKWKADDGDDGDEGDNVGDGVDEGMMVKVRWLW